MLYLMPTKWRAQVTLDQLCTFKRENKAHRVFIKSNFYVPRVYGPKCSHELRARKQKEGRNTEITQNKV